MAMQMQRLTNNKQFHRIESNQNYHQIESNRIVFFSAK